jgi:hypothetical protein
MGPMERAEAKVHDADGELTWIWQRTKLLRE